MEINQALKTAHETIIRAGLPGELQQAAFTEVLHHLLGGTPQTAEGNAVQHASAESGSQSSGLGGWPPE